MSGLSFIVVGTASKQGGTRLCLGTGDAGSQGDHRLPHLFFHHRVVGDVFQGHPNAPRAQVELLFQPGIPRAEKVLEMFDRKLQVEGCPLYKVYQAGCVPLDARLRGPGGERSKQQVSLKNMEHVKRAHGKRRRAGIAETGIRLDSAGDCRQRRAVHRTARHGLGRDEHVRRHRAAGQRDDGGDGAGRFRRAHHDRRRPAGGDSLDVRLQLAGA